jgi:hypothetical protein
MSRDSVFAEALAVLDMVDMRRFELGFPPDVADDSELQRLFVFQSASTTPRSPPEWIRDLKM